MIAVCGAVGSDDVFQLGNHIVNMQHGIDSHHFTLAGAYIFTAVPAPHCTAAHLACASSQCSQQADKDNSVQRPVTVNTECLPCWLF